MQKKWTKDLVVQELQRLYGEGVAINYHSLRNTSLMSYCRKLFGSYPCACQAAGIDYDQIREHKPIGYWTPERIEQEVVQIYEQYQGLITLRMIKEINSPLCEAMSVQGINFKSILCKYKLKQYRPQIKWTTEYVCQEVQRLHAIDPIYIRQQQVAKRYSMLLKAAQKLFGSWGNAVTQAGFDYGAILAMEFSLGELQIREILDRENMSHIVHARPSWLGGHMHLDFYMKGAAKAIEYNGKQHYHPAYFGGKYDIEVAQKELQSVQVRDKSKEERCKKNGIDLLVIKYSDKNIEKRVVHFLRSGGAS